MYDGYLNFGGNEVANNARTMGYARTAECPLWWYKGEVCEGLWDALAEEDLYSYANITSAPWYDSANPESARFFGVFIVDVHGEYNSTRKVSVTEGVGEGGVLGPTRKGVRELRVKAIVAADGLDALEYGMAWLSRVLDPGTCGQHGTGCGTVDLAFFADCPPSRADVRMPYTEWAAPITNYATNPSMETAGPGTVIRTNYATNPSFEQATAATVETARNLAPHPSFEAAGAVAAVRWNLATNPSFETGNAGTQEVRRNLQTRPRGTSNWTGWANTGGAGTSTFGNTGGGFPGVDTFARLTITTAVAVAGSSGFLTSRSDCPVTAGTTYSFRMAGRTSRTTGVSKYRLEVKWYTAAGVQIGASILTDAPFQGAGVWHDVVAPGLVAPATAEQVVVAIIALLDVTGNTVGDTFDATACLIETSPVIGTYFDGATVAAGDFTYAWAGTANTSQSIQYGKQATGAGGRSNTAAFIQSSEWASSGTKSVRGIPIVSYSEGDGVVATDVPVVAGKVYTIRALLRLTAPLTGTKESQSRRLAAWFPTSSSLVYSDPAPNLAGVHQVTMTVTAPAGETKMDVRAYLGIMRGGGEMWVDDLMVVEGTYTGPYFDGSTPAKVRRNRARNPGQRANSTYWHSAGLGVGGANANISVSREVAPWATGGYATRGTSLNATPNNAQVSYEDDRIPFTAGEVIFASIKVRSSHARTLRLRIRPNAGGDIFGPTETFAAGEVRTLAYATTLPAGSTRLAVTAIYAVGGDPFPFGAYIEASDALIESGSTGGPYFDGTAVIAPYVAAWEATANDSASYLYDPDYTYVWTGTAHASVSDQRAPSVLGYVGSGVQIAQSGLNVQTRTKSVRAIASAGVNVGDVRVSTGSAIGFPPGMAAGKTYTATARMYTPVAHSVFDTTSASRQRRILFFHSLDGVTYIQNFGPQAPNTPGWHTVTHTFTIPANATGGIVGLGSAGDTTAPFETWWDNLIITEGTYVYPYFDGSTVPVGTDLLYAWTGTVDASASVQYGTVVPAMGGTAGAAYQSTAWAAIGAKSLAIDNRHAGGVSYSEFNLSSIYPGGMPALVGKTFTALATIRTVGALSQPTGQNQRTIMARFYGSTLTPQIVSGYPTGPVEQLRVTFTVPADATAVAVRLHGLASNDTNPDGIAWWDALLITEGTYTGPYFDGSTPVKLRQNLMKDPGTRTVTYCNFWSGPTGTMTATTVAAAWSQSGFAYRGTWVGGSGSETPGVRLGGNGVKFSPGETITVEWDIVTPVSMTLGPVLGGGNTAGWSVVTSSGPVTTQPGVPAHMWLTVVVGTGADARALGSCNPRPVNGWAEISNASIYSGAKRADYLWFDGDSYEEGGIFSQWEGTSNASASYLFDEDFTYAWTGVAHASTSTQSAKATVVGYVPVSGTKAIASLRWADDRDQSLRLIAQTGSSSNNTHATVSGLVLTPGKTYTVSAVIHLDAAQTGALNSFARKIAVVPGADEMTIESDAAPNAAGDTRLSLTFTVVDAGYTVYLFNGAKDGAGDVWWDSLMITESSYAGPYFDGETPDNIPGDVIGSTGERYTWAGAVDASTSTFESGNVISVEDPVEWERLTTDLYRYMHDTGAVSGPLVTGEFESAGFLANEVEFTFVSERPYVFKAIKALDLPPGLPTVIQDIPFNLAPYPSAELSSGTVIVAKNFVTNPSVEAAITGWVASSDGVKIPGANIAVSQSNELASAGTKSAKVLFTAPSANTAGWMAAQQDVPLTGITPTTRYSVNLWAVASVQSGTAVLGTIDYFAYWMDAASTVLRQDLLGTKPASGGAVSVKSILPPPGTTKVLIRARQNVTSWSAGALVRLYVDAAAVTVP